MHSEPAFDSERMYWNARYANGGNSGAGSYGDAMLRKVEWLSELEGVETITEIGCGDFSFGSHLMAKKPDALYAGFDISETIVARNQKMYGQHSINFEPLLGSVIAPGSDLLLCVDVLFHIADDSEYEAMIRSLDKLWTKYLALSAYEYDGIRQGHVHIRKFDPSRFGVPILREVIEDDGSMLFYIFRR